MSPALAGGFLTTEPPGKPHFLTGYFTWFFAGTYKILNDPCQGQPNFTCMNTHLQPLNHLHLFLKALVVSLCHFSTLTALTCLFLPGSFCHITGALYGDVLSQRCLILHRVLPALPKPAAPWCRYGHYCSSLKGTNTKVKCFHFLPRSEYIVYNTVFKCISITMGFMLK